MTAIAPPSPREVEAWAVVEETERLIGAARDLLDRLAEPVDVVQEGTEKAAVRVVERPTGS